jgi:hypothetical protein
MAAKTEKLRTVQNSKGQWKWHLVGRNGKSQDAVAKHFFLQ